MMVNIKIPNNTGIEIIILEAWALHAANLNISLSLTMIEMWTFKFKST